MAYRGGTADEVVLKEESFENDALFTRVPEYKPSSDHVILDIGAHIGAFSLLASSKVPQGKVYAIEACQDTFNYLSVNIALNRATNISHHHLAIMDKSGSVTLYYDSGNWGHSVVRRLSRRSEEVQACSLAEFMEQYGIQRCDFVKFNCEGAEFPIILNTPTNVLNRCRTMLVLFHMDLWWANTPHDLMSHLTASGFRCDLYKQSRYRGWIIAQNVLS
jgi:FkbM family methyltransferase